MRTLVTNEKGEWQKITERVNESFLKLVRVYRANTDEAAFNAAFNEFYVAADKWIRKQIRLSANRKLSQHDVDNQAQNFYLKTCGRNNSSVLKNFQPERQKSPAAYLSTILKNQLHDYSRRQRRNPSVLFCDRYKVFDESRLPSVPANNNLDEADVIKRCIATLGKSNLRFPAVDMFKEYLAGTEHQAMAERYMITTSSIVYRLKKIFKKIQHIVASLDPERTAPPILKKKESA